MLVSFIIPAYNASATIIRALDSISSLNLNPADYEVIVVDDCSKDNTIQIVENYATNHSNVVLLLQKENHRQGAARNRAITVAKGKYCVFLDSDDEMSDGVVDALSVAQNNKADLVAMGVDFIDGQNTVTSVQLLPYQSNEVFSGVSLQQDFPFWFPGPVAYVYNLDFVRRVAYPFCEDVLFEDSDFVNVHLYHAKRMFYVKECGYRAHYNANSTTHTLSYKHLSDYLLLGVRMLNFYESLENKQSKYAHSIQEGGCYNVWNSMRRLYKLSSFVEIGLFYKRIDQFINREELASKIYSSKYWTKWTRFALTNKNAVFVLSLPMLLIRKILKQK